MNHLSGYHTYNFYSTLAFQYKLKIHQIDIECAFFNGVLKEWVYIEELSGIKGETIKKNYSS